MTDADLAYLDGDGLLAIFDELQVVYHVAFPGHDLDDHRRRMTRLARSDGFAAITARREQALVGFAYGLPLTVISPWWDGLDPPAPEGFTGETGTRTFAVIDLAVLPEHRGQGLGHRLLDDLLADRPEQRATLATGPAELANQQMYQRWGWHKIGRVPGAPGEPQTAFDLYVLALPPNKPENP